jgi:alkylation response protein AidB-like acyl-CoA dehydrogenase
MSEFFQDGPRLSNAYEQDTALRRWLEYSLPEDVRRDIEPGLNRLGRRAVEDIAAWGADAERNPPKLVPFDPWGRRIDRIDTARGWQELEKIASEEGIVATAYERAHGEYSRIHQMVRLYLFHPSSAVASCPLAMTDGSARLIEVHGDRDLRERVYPRLVSRDPATFWTSGQWMTERTGGSDVGGTSTIARRADDGAGFLLHGTKWFTSATTSPMAMTLARIEDESGASVGGSRGLSLFYLETRKEDGSLNEIQIHRLKDKLGTKGLPTAELSLLGTRAKLIGQPGEGVKRIVTLVNVTRVYNAACAVSSMRRAVMLARDYASRRSAFGKKLFDQPAHLETLAELEVESQGGLALLLHVAGLMGKEELQQASEIESGVLRILVPVIKLYTGKQGVRVISEVLELFGGAGYVEDTGLPVMLRDAQVLPIWEGTTNVLSLDVLRSMAREGTLVPWGEYFEEMASRSTLGPLAGCADQILSAIHSIRQFARRMMAEGDAFSQASARSFAYSIARTSIAGLLLEHARWSLGQGKDGAAMAVLGRWCRQDLAPLIVSHAAHRGESSSLALDQAISLQDVLQPTPGS